MLRIISVILLMLVASAAQAKPPLFDSHVHLWDGEASLRAYEKQVSENVSAFDLLNLDDSEKAKIGFENAQRLFGLAKPSH